MSTMIYRTSLDIVSAMNRVYAKMALAVVTSMVVAFLVSSSPALTAFFLTGAMKWVVIFAPLVAILAMSFTFERWSATQLQLFLHGFAAVFGLSMSTIFLVYTIGSVVSAFMGAAVLFTTMSLYGYFTKRNLDSIGQFLFVGLIAIIIASVINLFVGSSVATMVISAISILVFLGLTAYDTQKIREMVSVAGDTSKEEVIGALSLYLDFINLFLNLLQLFGQRK